MTQIITIKENNHVTGVVYGTVDIPGKGIRQPQAHKQTTEKVRKARVQMMRNHHTVRQK